MIRALLTVAMVCAVSAAARGVLAARASVTPEELQGEEPPAGGIWLETLGVRTIQQGWGEPQAAKSVMGNPITVGGARYQHGIGTHADSDLTIDLKGSAERFLAVVGVDNEAASEGSVIFRVLVDGKVKAETELLRAVDAPKLLSVDLAGAKQLRLLVSSGPDGANNDHADWAGAALVLKTGASGHPVAVAPSPPPSPKIAHRTKSSIPEIHGPAAWGTTPGRPFLYLISATGQGPLTFSVDDLPDGLKVDGKTGIISGSVQKAGRYTCTLKAKGPRGWARRSLLIVAGEHKLAQTPPMGWNSWNVWAGSVDDAKVRQAADWMVKSGLAAHGYRYINIDDCWEGGRAADGSIQTNEKFPDMKALADYVHSKGLLIGIYSSPGPKTCAGFEGSYHHEEQDAKTWAAWGIDYVKYDWCSYGEVAGGNGLPQLQKPYITMRKALDGCGRDIVFSLCQYGMGEVWKWGAEVGGNLWRTTGDINDSWQSMASIGFSQADHAPYAGPGHWNDPDMMVVGKLGWGPNIHPTRLNPAEQQTHVTLWSLLAAPLILGCDLSQLDEWTLDLLCNDEVIQVNQDPLGAQARRVLQDGDREVWVKALWDGSIAVGLFNRGPAEDTVSAGWEALGLHGDKTVRDLWRRKDLGKFDKAFDAKVASHGCVLVQIKA